MRSGARVSPLFVPDGRGRPPGRARREDRDGPDDAPVADQRTLDLTPGRRLRTRTAGVFLFLPLLTQVCLDQLVAAADSPGSEMVPAPAAILAQLTLKL